MYVEQKMMMIMQPVVRWTTRVFDKIFSLHQIGSVQAIAEPI